MKAILSTLSMQLLPALFFCAALPPPSPMKKRYRFNTPKDPFYIAEFKKRFYLLYGDESIGSYATAEDAAEDIGLARFVALTKGLDMPSLNIPRDLNKWERLG